MLHSEERILIVGAGEAGVSAASTLRTSGYAGEIVLINQENTLPYERPPLSKDVLLGHTEEPAKIRTEGWYDEQGIRLISGARLVALAPASRLAEIEAEDGISETLPFSSLLLATGARPRRLDGFGENVLYLRTVEDGRLLRERLASANRVAIIGAGVIGLEVASSARALNKDVCVIDIAPRLMARALTSQISELLLELHRNAGVEMHLGVTGLSRHPNGIQLADGLVIEADLIVAGIGVTPNSEIAETCGCLVDNGIVVDHRGETSVPGIFAAGDVAAFPHPVFQRAMRVEAWQHAGRHGAHVARAMLGTDDGYREIPWFWSDQHGLNLQVVGLTDGATDTAWRGNRDRGTALHFVKDRLVAATTVNNGRDIRPLTKLIAAGWRGETAALVDETRPLGKIVDELMANRPLEAVGT